MVFDGDCNFCRRWISRWQQSTGDRIEYISFQDTSVAARFPELSRKQCEQAVQFIDTNGHTYSAAEAVFRALAVAPRGQWPVLALPTLSRRRARHRIPLPLCRQEPHRVFVPHPSCLGPTNRATNLPSHPLALSPTSGGHLPDRVRFPLDADRRTSSAATVLHRPHSTWNLSITGRVPITSGTPT